MAIAGVELARAFIRPSGTEDVLRLYVEAKEEQKLNDIVKELTEFVKNCPDVN